MIHAVPITELASAWGRVREPLARLARKAATDGWIPEDVYTLCACNQATLYVNDGPWCGFAVLQLLPRYTQKRLHVWILHCEQKPEPFMQDLRELARSLGASVITFQSPRRGWNRRAEALGFKAVSTNYEQEV
jgi:hypothetical protein